MYGILVRKWQQFIIITISIYIMSLALLGNIHAFSEELYRNNFWLNVFFVNFTFFGDAVFAFTLIAFCFFKWNKIEEGFQLLFSVLISIIIIQVIKNAAIHTTFRFYFESSRVIENDELLLFNNYFPPAIPQLHLLLPLYLF